MIVPGGPSSDPCRAASVHIGTSGWHYLHWRGVFYPSGMRPSGYLSHYAREFETVEIDSTFYRLPSRETVASWRDTSPPGFLFAVKASQYITHRKRLLDPDVTLAPFLALAEVLGDRLGPILFQLPPRWRPDVPRLEHLLEALPTHHRYAFEFRDPRWFVDGVAELLCRHGAAFCLWDRGGLATPAWVTAPFAYLRFHGAGDWYQGCYTDAMLSGYAARIREWSASGIEVFCYFNNDSFGHALSNARRLRELAGSEATTYHLG